MKTIKWLAGFFEDGKKSASSKRAALYISLFYQYLLVQGSMAGKVVNEMVLYSNALIILFCVGAVTSEFFSDKFKKEL